MEALFHQLKLIPYQFPAQSRVGQKCLRYRNRPTENRTTLLGVHISELLNHLI